MASKGVLQPKGDCASVWLKNRHSGATSFPDFRLIEHGDVLDAAVEPLNHAVDLRRSWRGQPVFNTGG
jgi:hypothetical protein